MITTRTLVSDLAAFSPQAMMIFTELRLSCAGCVMARFCTLEEVAAQYNLDLAVFLARIQQTIDGGV